MWPLMKLQQPPVFATSGRVLARLFSVADGAVCLQNYPRKRLDAWIRAQELQQRSWCSPYSEKLSVQYVGKLGHSSTPLQMTKGISTPIDCARHLSRLLEMQSVIALVNDVPWDMHRPLMHNCTIDFIHFKDAHHDPKPVNLAFWRSSLFLLAATLTSSFRQEHNVRVLSNQPTDPSDGAFVCDICFTPDHRSNTPWLPSAQELRALCAHGQKIAALGHDFVPLDATHELYDACFADEPLRRQQLANESGSHQYSDSNSSHPSISIYKMGDFVEASSTGPLISSTRLIGRFSVTSFQPLGWLRDHTPDDGHPVLVYRVQGVALPTTFLTHFTTFDRLIKWSREPNLKIPQNPHYVVPF